MPGEKGVRTSVSADEGENRVRLLETDYRMYIIFYMENIKNGTKTHVLALYGNPNPVCSGIPATGRGSPLGPRHMMEWCLGTPPQQSPKFVPRTHPKV